MANPFKFLLRAFAPISDNEENNFRAKLQAAGLQSSVIDCIIHVVKIGPSLKNPQARAYASAMERSFDEYGLPGLSMQIAYFLMNAGQWTGPEARSIKAVLNKWSRAQ